MKRATLRKSLALSALATMISAQPALSAGYVNNRASWQSLSSEAKIGYAQAINDSLNYVFADDSLAEALGKQGRITCLIANKITAAQLADRISDTYKDDRYEALAPSAVYIIRMTQECRQFINKARMDFGLAPQ
ncbi:MAG TPA: hypothetical protein PLX65_09255 [Accumulibacter sp.]|nr:hypothetical protein [Accumulibacter sp.]